MCYGVVCEDGEAIAWEDECLINPPECSGVEKIVEGQCCPFCDETIDPLAPVVINDAQLSTCFIAGKMYQQGLCLSDFMYLFFLFGFVCFVCCSFNFLSDFLEDICLEFANIHSSH